MGELAIHALGGFRLVDRDGREIKIRSRKGRALLAYLAARSDESHSRDRLATLLWEDTDEELARTSLRQAVASLRKALPADVQHALRTDTESVALDKNVVDSDLNTLRVALAAGTAGALRTALDHYRGELLDGVDAKSAAFEIPAIACLPSDGSTALCLRRSLHPR